MTPPHEEAGDGAANELRGLFGFVINPPARRPDKAPG